MMMRPLFAGLVVASVVAALEEVRVHLRLREAEAFEERFWRISTPGSGEYLKFLDRAEIAAALGADARAVDDARHWLRRLGASDIAVSPLRDSVTARLPSSARLALLRVDDRPSAIEFVSLKKGVFFDENGEDLVETTTVAANAIAEHDSDSSSDSSSDSHATAAGEEYTIANIKRAYGMPTDLTAQTGLVSQMVWGPGTFGYSKTQLEAFKKEQCPLLNATKVVTEAYQGSPGGDNFGEGNLDVQMTASFGLNVTTIVSNTNVSQSTEEGNGFGEALLAFLVDLANREAVPHVLSMSLGSLSSASCEALCDGVVDLGFARDDCERYLQTQRQVCMYLSDEQTAKISVALQILGARGVTVFGSSGDGGSHFSFSAFTPDDDDLASALNQVSCASQFPVFPTASPYVVSVGGTQWDLTGAPEVWDVGTSGSGSGFSRQFPAPAHQRALVATYLDFLSQQEASESLNFNAAGRAYPDVAAVGVHGTSQSCPIVAGMFSMVLDHRFQRGLPPLGLITPRLYGLYEDSSLRENPPFDDVFHDGDDSSTSCDNGFLPMRGGFDVITGLGRPNWPNLLSHFGQDNDDGGAPPLLRGGGPQEEPSSSSSSSSA